MGRSLVNGSDFGQTCQIIWENEPSCWLMGQVGQNSRHKLHVTMPMEGAINIATNRCGDSIFTKKTQQKSAMADI